MTGKSWSNVVVLAALAAVLAAAAASAAPYYQPFPDANQYNFKPYEPMRPLSAAVTTCPMGATSLIIPLDNTFTPVRFQGVACSGPSNPADSCRRNDDDFSLPLDLGFTFNFYGSSYNTVFINNNGNLSFGNGFCTFSSQGFPVNGFPMIAPFWADVDTRGAASGVVWYRLDAHRLVVIWDHVGYFNAQADKLNTFEVIISDGADLVTGPGNNVCFAYDDMQWTTGSASGGSGGFGGVPATVGANKGDGVNFFQIGRFDHAGTDYDPTGLTGSGVSYLDHKQYCFNATGTNNNIAPIFVGPRDTVHVCTGSTLVLNTSFLSPEPAQTTTVTVDLMGLANAQVVSTPGSPATQTVTFTPNDSQAGFHTIGFMAVDNGTPPETTFASVVIAVSHGATCSIQGPSVACPGQTGLSFTDNTAGPGETLAWHISGNGTIVGATDQPTVLVDAGASGSFTLGLTAAADTCASRCSTTVAIGACRPSCPKSAGFWMQQCAQKGNGSTKFSRDQVTQVAQAVDARSAFFGWPSGSAFDSLCVLINTSRPMDVRLQALRQFATLLANVAAGELNLQPLSGQYVSLDLSAPMTCGTLNVNTVGEFIARADSLLGALAGSSLGDAGVTALYGEISACADSANNGIGIGPTCGQALIGELPASYGSGTSTGGDGSTVVLNRPLPNPFKDQTRISYAVAGEGSQRVQVAVYDIVGRLVTRLVSGTQSPGIYSAVWDGRNSQGSAVNNGVYFIRIAVNGRTTNSRVVLVR